MKIYKRPEVEAFLKNPPVQTPACLIYGKDRGQVVERASALASKIVADVNDPFNVSLLTDTDFENDPARLEDELSSQSLMGGRRLIRLKWLTEKANLDKALSATLNAFLDGQFKSDAFFLIEAGSLGSDSSLRKLAETHKTMMTIVCYDDEPGDIIRMAREQLKLDQVALSPEAMEIFAQRLPKERGVARQEIERLSLYIGPGSGRTLSATELQDFLGVEPEASFFQAALDAFSGRMKAAQACLRRGFAEGENGITAIRALSLHTQKLRNLQSLLDQGLNAKDAAKKADIFWKQEAEMLRQNTVWRGQALEDLASELIEGDRACKTTGMPDLLISERLYMSIAARAKRAGL